MAPADLDRVFFSDSGSVAVEVALKMAVQYWRNRGLRGRSRFVAFKGGYHGDTTGRHGGVATRKEGFHAAFRRTVAGADLRRSAAGPRRSRRA